MYGDLTIAAIIPALNEDGTIAAVVSAVDRGVVDRIIVVDNGSTDDTAARARARGAEVVHEPRSGYGSACLAGITKVRESDVLVFLDGDGSDDPSQIEDLLEPIVSRSADLVIGSRTLGIADRGALTLAQRAGNRLSCALIRRFWGVRFTDLGPFRAVRTQTLRELDMSDPDMGWTIEMQVKAARRSLSVVEVPVRCRARRGGTSKISGSLVGSYRAGRRILGTIARARIRDLMGIDD